MSTLQTAAHTAVDEIPLGRRIAEIMRDKGMAYSQVAMSKRLGIGRETYRLMLSGEREIYTFELDKIAKDLKMPIERILQEDVKEQVRELDRLLDEMSNMQRAIELANQVNELSIGWTEKCWALFRLGTAYMYENRIEEAHQALLESHDLAKKTHENTGNPDLLYKVLFHLMDTFTMKKDFANASKILDSLEVTFKPTPHRLAAIYNLQAEIKQSLNKLDEARQFAYQCLEYAYQSGKQVLIGQASNNVAHYEYKLHNYEISKMHLEKAVEAFEPHMEFQFIATKEYAKTLLQLKETAKAVEVIESALSEIHCIENRVLEGKLLLLLAYAKGELKHAEHVVEQEKYGIAVRLIGCRFLMDSYCDRDSAKFLHYYHVSQNLIGATSFLDEEEL